MELVAVYRFASKPHTGYRAWAFSSRARISPVFEVEKPFRALPNLSQ